MRPSTKVLSKLFPTLTLANVLDTRKLVRDPQVLRSYTEDPLVHHGRIPVRTGTESAMAEVNARMEELSVPLLIFHGTNDDLAHPAGSKRLYARAASADKTLHLCEGLFHEVLNEPEHPALLADLVRPGSGAWRIKMDEKRPQTDAFWKIVCSSRSNRRASVRTVIPSHMSFDSAGVHGCSRTQLIERTLMQHPSRCNESRIIVIERKATVITGDCDAASEEQASD